MSHVTLRTPEAGAGRTCRPGRRRSCLHRQLRSSKPARLLSTLLPPLLPPLLSPLLCLLLAAAAPAQAQLPAGFDLDMLRERGIDPQVAEYFKESARFRPGVSMITLWVNGSPRGRVDALFNDKGELCFDQNLLDKGNLKIPQAPKDAAPRPGAPGSARCLDFMGAYPQTTIELRPGKEEVALVVPTDSLRPAETQIGNFQRGGTAAIANYDITASRSRFGNSSNSFLSANLELGLNLDDWIVRTRETYSRQNERAQSQHLFAYVQRTLVDHKSIFQAGQINILNTAFATGPITGAQLVPEGALTTNTLNNVMAQGIAQTQARVEVRQAGALIYSTIVPAGPFALSDLPLLNSTLDLEVTVIEANGAQRRFTVPAASLYAGNLGLQRGYSVALGKQRALGNSTGRQPWLVTASSGWPLGRDSTLNAGALGATGYQAASWGLSTRLGESNLNLQQRVSHLNQTGDRGTQFTLTSSSIIAQAASLGLSTTQQTRGYRDLGDTTLARASQVPLDPTDPNAVAQAQAIQTQRHLGQYSATLNWSNSTLGGMSLSYSRSTQSGAPSIQRVTASWGKTFPFGTVNLNLERQLGGSGTIGSTTGTSSPTIFYLTLSLPLGRASARAFVNNSGGYQRTGAAFSDQLGDYGNYSLAAERSGQNGDTDLSTQVGLLPRYAQLNLGYARYGSGGSTYNGGLRGGMVWHKGGLTLSPYAVQDTFGIVQVGDLSGIQVSTPQGPVWTDWNGQAVAAQLQPYSESRLEVATKTLPRNVDLRNGLRIVDPGRGAVVHADFQVLRVRRILLSTRDASGQPLPRGAPVLDADRQFVTTVVDDGQVFLLNATINGPLRVMLGDDQSCVLHFTLAERPDPEAFYEPVEAICRPDVTAQGSRP